jgi:thiol:disulfide interchange protein
VKAGPGAVPPSVVIDDPIVSVEVKATEDRVSVRLAPKKPYHLYTGTGGAQDLSVTGSKAANLLWAPVEPPLASGEVHEPVTFRLKFRREGPGAASGLVRIAGTGCAVSCEQFGPYEVEVRVEDPDAPTSVPPEIPVEAAAPVEPPGEEGLLFPVVGVAEKSWVERQWESLGLLILGPLFLVGLLLAFTPCVLPLIPITVSIVGGGRADLSRSRLTVLLTSYVLGLSLAFGSLGLVAAVTGASISAAFENPVALWVIAGVFVLLALGMFGLYELQPPQWLQRFQGQRKGGSIPAAFLFGALAAVIASPCTGPVIAAMIVFAAQAGNEALGFLMFFTLGLGMGAVLFAAGSLNFLLRPGPWMVWVRYVFGVLLVGVALYYVADAGLVSPTGLWVFGLLVGAVVAAGIARHLVRREGEASGPALRRGAEAGALVVVVTALVAFLTRPPPPVVFEGGFQKEPWITLRDRAHLKAEVEKARGRPVVVDTTADWCAKCKQWEHLIASDPLLRSAFSKMARLQIDVTKGKRKDLRSGIGAEEQQPFFVFLDAQGRIHRNLDLGASPDAALILGRLKEIGVTP